ncbi:Acetoin:2,6-dichlorophenolindophenol oxidoreductase subunit alpha [compost metagenome]
MAKAASTAIERNYLRAAAYGMPGVFVPGNDADAIFATAGEAIARARAGEGPSLIEIETHRLAGHFMGDGETYRPAGEKEALLQKDPIPAYRQRLLELGVLDEIGAAGIEERARGRVDAAVRFARDSDYPAPEEAMDKVFV